MDIETATLPANPNCVLFSADAGGLFGRRSHGQLVREMMTLAAPLHGRSGFPVLVGLGWRYIQDRRNQSSLMGTLFFVFDGPATADDLDQLERSVADGAQTFSVSSIERVPDEVVWAGVWKQGRPHVIVEPDPSSHDGQGRYDRWYARAFRYEPEYDPPLVQIAIDAQSDELPPWRRVTPVPAPYTRADEEVERLRLAFALHHATRIVDTITQSRASATNYLDELFPPELVARLGLDDPLQRATAVENGRQILPTRLGYHDKLAMVGLLFSVCFSEGPLGAAQMRALRDAAHELGVTNEQVVSYLQRLW